jgi:hypothetical protein
LERAADVFKNLAPNHDRFQAPNRHEKVRANQRNFRKKERPRQRIRPGQFMTGPNAPSVFDIPPAEKENLDGTNDVALTPTDEEGRCNHDEEPDTGVKFGDELDPSLTGSTTASFNGFARMPTIPEHRRNDDEASVESASPMEICASPNSGIPDDDDKKPAPTTGVEVVAGEASATTKAMATDAVTTTAPECFHGSLALQNNDTPPSTPATILPATPTPRETSVPEHLAMKPPADFSELPAEEVIRIAESDL